MINIQRRLLFTAISLVLGVSASGAAVKVAGTWEGQTARSRLLADVPANQASLWGRSFGSSLGQALAVGDVNGDGYDDLIADAPYQHTADPAGGEVYVIPGPLAFNNVYTMPQQAALIIQGPSGYSTELGTNLDTGDMNGDGFDDIVMNSYELSKTFVYLGRPSIQPGAPLTITASPENMALTISPAGSGSALCDFNGDGYQDLFVDQYVDHGTYSGVQVWGVLGSPTLTMTHPITRILPAQADIVIKEFHPAVGGTSAFKNMACGDVDGDGTPDLAIGVFGDSPGGRSAAGAVYVLRGDRTITAGHPVTLTMPDQAGAIIEGVDSFDGTRGDNLGFAVAVADVNRDGRADLIMGAPLAAGPGNLMSNAGEVYLWLGRALTGQRFVVSSQASWIVHGEQAGDHLGVSIAAGDFNRDGYPEILLGCPGCIRLGPESKFAGRGYVLDPLQITGDVTVSAVSKLTLIPYTDFRGLGWSVAAMDFNGDGFKDLLLGAPNWSNYNNTPGNLPGTVYAISYPDHFRSHLPVIQR